MGLLSFRLEVVLEGLEWIDPGKVQEFGFTIVKCHCIVCCPLEDDFGSLVEEMNILFLSLAPCNYCDVVHVAWILQWEFVPIELVKERFQVDQEENG